MPTNHASELDEINLRILAVAEDTITGFHPHPFESISLASGVSEAVVQDRLNQMLRAGTIRRVRQTLLSTSLADGALVAWRLSHPRYLQPAFDWLRAHDSFTGHIVIRESDDPSSQGAHYSLWTTLKVPTGYGSVSEHCQTLASFIQASDFIVLPVVGMFALSVGHVRRAHLKPGDLCPQRPQITRPSRPSLSPLHWRVLLSLKESLSPEEILLHCPWDLRARALGLSTQEFCAIAHELDQMHVIGRFATYLDHKGHAAQQIGSRASGLMHWAVQEGQEELAGAICGQHLCMTHCYWRSGATKALRHAQIMGVVHAASRHDVLAHKKAIDAALMNHGVTVVDSAVFWSLKAEIRPSEIAPDKYQDWCLKTPHLSGVC